MNHKRFKRFKFSPDRLFEKDQYYSDDPNSRLGRQQILHVEIADFLGAATRIDVDAAYQRAGIAPLYLALPPVTGGRSRWLNALKCGRRLGLPLITSVILEVMRARVARAAESLSRFKYAKVALLGYEYLFPVWFAYALQSRGIKIAASQERLMQAFLPDRAIIIDDYFVHSIASRDALKGNDYACISEMHIVGDVRIGELNRPVQRHQGFPVGAAHATLVLDWHSDPDPIRNSQNTTNNWANNISFYEDILRIARAFPNSSFVIRGKNADWISIPVFAEILSEIATLPNIVVSTDFSRPYIAYELASACDSVIARYTSLGDQCLASGKPVIYHEGTTTNSRLAGSIIDFKPYPIMVKTFDELLASYSRISSTGKAMAEQDHVEMIGYYFAPPVAVGDAKAVMRSRVEEILSTSRGMPA